MRVTVSRHDKPIEVFEAAEKSSSIVIVTNAGAFRIIENHDGTLSISESTYRQLMLQPVAMNAVNLIPTEPR